ncbi:hypothetical protein MAGR_40070 [Mycolicibacterium agri]|uniref:Uncharacterized protein n=1 Tax=Mycolicibacterium agri TaxID=36811 RepID=A0A7I9W5V6_MYCAG|nr:hypothetical protein MAGR_40070 [Mycolicibacterium agri]
MRQNRGANGALAGGDPVEQPPSLAEKQRPDHAATKADGTSLAGLYRYRGTADLRYTSRQIKRDERFRHNRATAPWWR